ncbi:MAG TPA: MaoC family dehydratase [Anaerolineae bacterium]
MKIGDIVEFERTFTEKDIHLFTRVSGDAGVHHVTPDEQGRLMVQGLLTATLPTKVGGDLNFIARDMVFHFVRPVFAGDTIRCLVTITALEQLDELARMSCQWVCRNQHGKEVLTGEAHGVIRGQSRA